MNLQFQTGIKQSVSWKGFGNKPYLRCAKLNLPLKNPGRKSHSLGVKLISSSYVGTVVVCLGCLLTFCGHSLRSISPTIRISFHYYVLRARHTGPVEPTVYAIWDAGLFEYTKFRAVGLYFLFRLLCFLVLFHEWNNFSNL